MSSNDTKVCRACGGLFIRVYDSDAKWLKRKVCNRSCAARLQAIRNEQTFESRFWSRLVTESPNGCWEWQGGVLKNGYGSVSFKGKNVSAHRVAWRLSNGDVPQGLHVLHKCDNPPCCNPAHLFVGTHLDNMKDMVSKGRKLRSVETRR